MNFGKVIAGIVVAAFLAGSVWVWTSAPCGWFAFSSVKDTPARCLMNR